MGDSKQQSYLLVGAGCFGASTAYPLKRQYPTAKVTLIDRTPFPCPSAAAHDLNKIVRGVYEGLLYLKLALEAMNVWNSDPIFKPWFHNTGLLYASDATRGNTIIDNDKTHAGKTSTIMLEPEAAKERFGGVFRDADWSLVSKCTYNPDADWADTEQALRIIIQASVDLGVEYVSATVSTITFDKDNSCTGVRLSTGEELQADHTVLCTSAHTALLLAESAPERNEMQVDGRMVAAGGCMCLFKIPKDQMSKFQKAPAIIAAEADYPGE